MSIEMLFDTVAFIVVLVVLMSAGCFQSRRVATESSYLFAERKIKLGALTATLVMTEFNSATLISFASLGYAAGFWALSLPFIFLLGLLFYAAAVAKKWKEYDGFSVGGFFTQRYGSRIGSCVSALLLVAMIGFSSAYIKSLTLLFLPAFPSLDPWVVSSALCFLVVIMTLRGGLVSIIRTDQLSLILMLLFFPLTAFFIWKSPTLPPLILPATLSAEGVLPLRFVFSLTILTMFTYILAPWYGQKIFASENAKVAYRSVIAAAFLIFILYGSAILATALFRYRGYPCPSAEMALPYLINCCLPSGMKGCAYALLFAASATTLTGVWSAMSAMWIGDFAKTKNSFSPRRGMRITLLFALLSFVLANTLVDKVFDQLILANIPIAALSFGLLGGFYWKKASRRGVVASIAVGVFFAGGAYLIFGEEGGYTWYWAVIGIPLIFLTGIGASLLLPEKRSTSV